MATTANPSSVSLGRAAGIDVGIVTFGTGAVILSFFTGNGVDNWQNAVFAPLVFVLAAITMLLVVAEIRTLWKTLPQTAHQGRGIAAVMVPIIATIVVGPMLLIMPFFFLGAFT